MKKILSSSGWLLLAGLLFLLCALVTLARDGSLFTALFLWAGVLLGILLFRLLMVALGEFRGHPRAHQFLARFQVSRKIYVLREHWRSGARTLKRLNRFGAEMPWFVFVGGRDGKTTLLDSAQLPVLSQLDARERILPTRTLKWWFFKQLCVLDVGSHFSTGNATALRSWKRLVQWSKQVRSPEGVLVSISCAALQAHSPAQLHEHGRRLREQLEQLIKACGQGLPIHIVVTGIDALPGFKAWQQTLTDEQREHALGYQWVRPPVVDRNTPFLEPLFDTLCEGLLSQCLSTLDATPPDKATAQRLGFPERVQALKPSLLRFVVALCEPDPYHATGALKGVWLTAAPAMGQAREKRQGHFVAELLSQRLLQTAQSSAEQRYMRFPGMRRVSLATVVFALAVGALLWSGWKTHRLYDEPPASGMALNVARLAQLDAGFAQPMMHVPYLPLMRYWQARLERQLLEAGGWREGDHLAHQAQWQQQFAEADAAQKRQMILQLSAAVLLQEAMLDQLPLSELAPLHRGGNTFYPLAFDKALSPKEVLLITRAWGRRHPDRLPLAEQRALLSSWVAQDSAWTWLLQGRDKLSALGSASFWPRWPVQTELSGLWLQAGEQAVQEEVALVSRALDSDDQQPFEGFWNTWHQRRQEAWLAFIGDTIAQAHEHAEHPLASDESVALLNGQDPASRFIARIVSELTTIPSAESQAWLDEMRRVSHLQAQPATLQDQVFVWEKGARGWLYRQFGSTRSQAYASQQDRQVWQAWRDNLAAAVNMTLRPADLAKTAHGLFVHSTSEGQSGSNPLETLQAAFTQLEKHMALPAQRQGSGTVWELLRTQVDALTANAVSVVACELEAQWQNQVLQPLNDPRLKHNPRRQEDMAWQLFQHFLNDKAQSYLTPGQSGLSPKYWQGSAIPFTAEFLQVLNSATSPQDLERLPLRDQTRRQDELTALQAELASLKDVKAAMSEQWLETRVITQPATVPGGAALMPTGTKLSLSCGPLTTALTSANLLEERVFRWAPGQCQGVSLSVIFPQGELKRQWLGGDAWPRFLQTFASGEQRYALEAFESADPSVFSLQGVNEVLVRFSLKGHESTLERWRAWQGVEQAMVPVQGQISALQEAVQQHGNYFTGNLTALPVSAVQCPR